MKEKIESIIRMLHNRKIQLQHNIDKSHLNNSSKEYLNGQLSEITNLLYHLEETVKY